MKLYNLLNGAILTLLLVCFLVAPQKVLAVDFNFFDFIGEDNYKVLSEFEGKKILQNFPDILYDKWVLLRGNGYSNPMEETTLCLLKYVSTLSMWNYLFRDLPMDVSFNIAKESVDIARLVGTEDTSGILAKIEKGTVDIAVNYLKEYLSKGQIKVSFGAMEMKYKDGNKEIENPLQYIIMYKRIDDKRSKVVARIYSPKAIVPPASRGSLGMVLGFSSSLNPGEKLSPFIVEINGIMDDGLYGSYFWDKDNTIIKTIFPEVVPDFGLKPKTWQQKYIIDPVKGIIDSFSGVFKSFTGSENNLTEYIFKDTANQEAIDKEVEAMSEGKAIEEDYPVKEIKNNIEEKKKETVKEEKKEVVKEEKKKEEVEVKIVPVLCSKSNQSVSSYDVIINEVAWMGSKNSANDEWIELKNTSNSGINLKGWTLRDGEDQINIVFEDITVSKGGFLLLERTDDNSVPTKTADLIYKGALSNSEEELYLFDSNCSLKDFVSGNPEWTAGDSSNKKTMERNDDLSGWHTYSGSGSNNIWGTPKENNSIVNKETAVVVVASSGGFSSGMTYGGDPVINYCSQTNLSVPNTSKVIINEVAWMGNNSDANDEWIELKNVSSEAVNLNNWQLLDAGNIRIILDSAATINPQGFYLLERTNDDSVPNIQMNKEYVGALSNSSESLRLFDSSCQLMDEVLANPDWPGGDNELKKTMERDADLSGWHTYSPEVVDTLSGLWGTPKAENSLKIVIEEQEEEEEEKEEDDDPEDNPPINNNSNHLLITEIGTGEGGGAEYVELYNQTESLIELCPSEESCSYLSYYSPASEWYDPSRNWKFPSGATINPNSYYIIDIFGNTGGSGADWKVKSLEGNDYETGQLGNLSGSLSLFSNNPKYVEVESEEEPIELTNEEKNATAIALKIDAFSWKSNDTSPIVKEGEAFLVTEVGRAIGRKWSSGKYQDTDSNANDFQLEDPSLRNHTPKIPGKVQDLVVLTNEEQKNSVILSWTAPTDEDTASENLDYEIYYSRNSQIDDNNLVNIKDYTNVSVISEENNKRKAIVKDLFYDSSYYFKVVAKDPEKNISPLSDPVSYTIEVANHQKRAPLYDFRRSGHSQFSGPAGTGHVKDILVEGNMQYANDSDFTATPVIDENGTIYFWGNDDGSFDFYAYAPNLENKWILHCPDACGFYPSLGKDGTIYLSSNNAIYAVSPSGKVIWKKEYNEVYTKAIIMDSHEKIYFLANKQANRLSLFSLDSKGEEKELHDNQEILKGAHSSSSTELVIDELDNIYFSINDYVLKYSINSGEVINRQFFPKFDEGYIGDRDVIVIVSQVNILFDGTLLLTLSNGRRVGSSEEYAVLYALDNNLSQVLWSRDDLSGPLGFNEEEFYYSKLISGSYPMLWYFGAANITTGETKWERAKHVSSPMVSDASNRIYFSIYTMLFGYDSNNMPDDLEDSFFYSHSTGYYGEAIAIGKENAFLSDTQRVCRITTL